MTNEVCCFHWCVRAHIEYIHRARMFVSVRSGVVICVCEPCLSPNGKHGRNVRKRRRMNRGAKDVVFTDTYRCCFCESKRMLVTWPPLHHGHLEDFSKTQEQCYLCLFSWLAVIFFLFFLISEESFRPSLVKHVSTVNVHVKSHWSVVNEWATWAWIPSASTTWQLCLCHPGRGQYYKDTVPGRLDASSYPETTVKSWGRRLCTALCQRWTRGTFAKATL